MVEVHNDGPAPVMKEVADDIVIGEVINDLTDWDEARCNPSLGDRIPSMIMNTLEDRSPLYKMESYMDEWGQERGQ